jgi:CBS domain containing-hemolysin-like protein
MIIIAVNIAFDILGTAATAATEAPLNAMAARKVSGAQEGLHLVKNADKVANFCNDVIGDVSGIIAGALGITLMSRALLAWPKTSELWLNILVTASIASVTVAGKAMGKRVAVTQANQVIFLAGRVIAGYRRVINLLSGRSGKNAKKKVRSIGRS